MKNLKDLSEKLTKQNYYDALNILDSYSQEKYDYLCISRASWETNIVMIIEKMLESSYDHSTFIGELCYNLNNLIKAHISGKIKNKDVRIFNNLVIKLRRKGFSGERLIIAYIREIEGIGISFNKDLYTFLIKDAEEFKKACEELHLVVYSFAEFSKRINLKAHVVSYQTQAFEAKKAKTKKQEKKTKNKELYSRFPDYDFVTPIEKKIIINYLLNRLSDVRKEKILKLINNEIMNREENKIIGSILGNTKVLYNRFIETGHLPESSSLLNKIYRNIAKRKRNEEGMENKEYLALISYEFSTKRKILLSEQMRILECLYREQGHSKEEFLDLVAKTSESINLREIISEEEMMATIINLIYESIKEPLKRA